MKTEKKTIEQLVQGKVDSNSLIGSIIATVLILGSTIIQVMGEKPSLVRIIVGAMLPPLVLWFYLVRLEKIEILLSHKKYKEVSKILNFFLPIRWEMRKVKKLKRKLLSSENKEEKKKLEEEINLLETWIDMIK